MNYAGLGKRGLDFLIIFMALGLAIPLLLLTSLLIFLDDGGPLLFSQERVGKDLKLFRIFKFRSMKTGTSISTSATASRDSITRIGKIIRRTNIDELPQLFNVLVGDMSIVGPRPALPSQEILVNARVASGAASLRPGLTGLAQVNAFDGMSETEKANWDADYSDNVSLALDLKIVLRTVAYLFRRQPVY